MTSDQKHFGHWCPSTEDIVDIDTVGARDLMIECFYQAQHATFERMKMRMGTSWDEASVRKSVTGAIRTALNQVGADWDAPTRSELVDAVEVLAKRAKSWGTPEDIIDHHRVEIEKVLQRLRD